MHVAVFVSTAILEVWSEFPLVLGASLPIPFPPDCEWSALGLVLLLCAVTGLERSHYQAVW